MPIVAYYSMKRRRVQVNKDECKRDAKVQPLRELRDVVERIKVNIKTEAEIAPIAARKDFVRWCTGLLSIEEMVSRCKAVGSSQWYV